MTPTQSKIFEAWKHAVRNKDIQKMKKLSKQFDAAADKKVSSQ